MPLSASQIHEHMKVIGADGQHVGTVDNVEGNRIKLTKSDPTSGGEHRYVEFDQVDEIRGDEICLATGAKPSMH